MAGTFGQKFLNFLLMSACTPKQFFFLKTCTLVSSFFLLLIPGVAICQSAQNSINAPIEIVFTSDAHYAITRKAFRGDTNVNSHIVNTTMISQINNLPTLNLPADNGVSAGKNIGYI